MGYKSMLPESLGEMIRKSAESISDFADKIDVPKTTIYDILKGKNSTVYTLLRISGGTGSSPDELLGWDDKLKTARSLLECTRAYYNLTQSKQEKAAYMVAELLEAFKKTHSSD